MQLSNHILTTWFQTTHQCNKLILWVLSCLLPCEPFKMLCQLFKLAKIALDFYLGYWCKCIAYWWTRNKGFLPPIFLNLDTKSIYAKNKPSIHSFLVSILLGKSSSILCSNIQTVFPSFPRWVSISPRSSYTDILLFFPIEMDTSLKSISFICGGSPTNLSNKWFNIADIL